METPKVEITVDASPNESSIDSQGYTLRLAIACKARRREYGLWGWCAVEVNARIGNFEASAYASESSYKGEEDFRQAGIFDDLKNEALADLERNICNAEETIAAYREQYQKKH